MQDFDSSRLACSQAVLVHQLSKRTSQNPFRKNGGRVACVAFHPAKPFFFVGEHPACKPVTCTA